MVSYCPRCGKRVFFAERKSSLGKDWHGPCLKCEACRKVLNPGQHAEHKGIPYCEVPCYKSLFGPKLYGFGSTVESHTFNSRLEKDQIVMEETDTMKMNTANKNYKTQTSTTSSNVSMEAPRIEGRPPKLNQEQITSLQEKCDVLNKLHPENFIDVFEKDSSVTLEGSLRVHWGVQTPIKFKRDNSRELTPFTKRVTRGRVSKSRSFHQVDIYEELPTLRVSDDNEGRKLSNSDNQYDVYVQAEDPFNSLKQSGLSHTRVTAQELLAVKMRRGQFHTIKENKNRIKRRCSINGHYYNMQTSDNFTPAFGSVTKVFVGSYHRTGEVIKKLLNKFKIENESDTFSLYLVKQNGEMWPLKDDEFPLMSRVDLVDTTARLFLMDKPDALISQKQNAINTNTDENSTEEHAEVWKPVVKKLLTCEVASFTGLPEPVLQGFLDMFDDEEEKAAEKIKLKYNNYRRTIEEILSTRQMTEETFL